MAQPAAAPARRRRGAWWCRRGGIWLLVALWPAESRPYIGGSQNNSILELALGYNGLGRLTGNEIGGLGNMNRDVGWGRLLGGEMGGQIGWLLPAAVIALVAGLFIAGGARAPTRRGPRCCCGVAGWWSPRRRSAT